MTLDLPFQRHSQTSQAAAESIAPKAATLRAQVLEFIRARGPVTDEEIADGLKLNPSTARPRRVELSNRRLIVKSGIGTNRSGRSAACWKAVA